MELGGRFRSFAFLLTALLAGQSYAQGLERQAAPFASTGLAIIAPTFNGSDGNTSFIRFANIGTASSTYTVTVVGSPSGRTYGTTTYTVAAGASPQYSLSQITTQANAAALSGGDDSYALYLQDADQYAGYEHVIYNGTNGFFENVSTCSTLLAPATGGVLTNVHTSKLTSYPSQIRIHNYGTQSATYRATVSDASTGTSIGTVDLPVAANASAIYQESYLEEQLHWTPTASQLHVNVALAPVGSSNFYAVLGQYIFNQQFSAYVSMSEICAINPRSAGTATAAIPASDVEHQAAPFATTGLAVIGPTFSGSDGNSSFIRFANAGTAASTYTVTVVGSPSGRTYGTTTYSVPAGASPQYSLSQITTQANAAALSGGDDSYALYLQDSDQYAGYEHVIYNGANGFFENVGTCSTLLAPATGSVLTNVHTSKLASYPSQVRIHNYGTQSATYRVTVSDAATGTSIGTVDVPVAANASAIYQESYFEQQLHWTPSSTQLHANLTIAPVGSSNFYAVTGQYIFNQQFSAYVNMSEICAINAPSSTGGSTSATTTFDGAIAGSSQTGTLSVTVQGAVAASALLEYSAVERPRATLTATGTFRAAGASDVTLSGTYDTATGAISLTGGGYTFTGTVGNGGISGSYTATGGVTGGFTVLKSGQASVKTYCGTYVPGDDHGIFNIVVSASGSLTGLARSTDGQGSTVLLIGQANGASVSGRSSEGVSFTATITGDSISGNYTSVAGNAGTFSGSTSGCSTPVTSTGGSSGGTTGGGTTGGGTGGSTTGNLIITVTSTASGSGVTATAPYTQDGKTTTGTIDTCSKGTCGYGIDVGKPVTLTANVGAGDTFLGWSGACTGTNTTCLVTTTSEQQTVTATFASGQKHTLTVNSSGTGFANIQIASGQGKTCTINISCSGSFAGTATLTVSFLGNQTTFLGWGGACSGTGSCTVDMSTGDQTVTAQFSSPTGSGGSSGSGGTGSSGGSGTASSATLDLTVTRTGLGADGSVTSSPAGINCSNFCSTYPHAFNTGTVVTLTATPASGSTFQGWGGACSGTGTCTVTMSSNQSVTATFSKP